VISLADLASLHDRYADALAAPVTPVTVAGPRDDVVIGDGSPALMGCVNLSRDSTYKDSVAVDAETAVRMGRVLAAQGAHVIDVGAESSGPHARRVGAEEQSAVLGEVVAALADDVVVSVETYHPEVVATCLKAGARVLNLTGRRDEETMLRLAADHGAAVVMCFGEEADVRESASSAPAGDDALPALLDHFGPRLEHARSVGVREVVLDPGLGFTYANLTTPAERAGWQARMLAQTFRLRPLGAPLCHSLPHSFDLFGAEYRKAEGFFAVLAALGGAHLYRVHEVAHVRAVLGAMDALSL
jgi:dihydropteroate synthase